MRMAVPLGMNMCSPFRSISTAVRPPSLIPPPRNVIEDETRRNTFWLIYCAERLHGLGNGWAMSVDDDDISQMMPVLSEQFEHSVRRSFDQTRRPSLIVAQILVSPADRQWAHTRGVLLQNPPAVTDSFTLYIKGAILLCTQFIVLSSPGYTNDWVAAYVKRFNLRFRSQHFAGNPEMSANLVIPAGTSPYMQSTQDENFVDPRTAPAFIELERTATTFRDSFPPHLRYPIQNNVVDNHLYIAHMMPYV